MMSSSGFLWSSLFHRQKVWTCISQFPAVSEMPQPQQNNPYRLSSVPYSPLHPTPCLRMRVRIMAEIVGGTLKKTVRASFQIGGIEHDVHFVLCRAALYAHRFSDDVGEESMLHSQHQECKSIGGKLQLDSIGKQIFLLFCTTTSFLFNTHCNHFTVKGETQQSKCVATSVYVRGPRMTLF